MPDSPKLGTITDSLGVGEPGPRHSAQSPFSQRATRDAEDPERLDPTRRVFSSCRPTIRASRSNCSSSRAQQSIDPGIELKDRRFSTDGMAIDARLRIHRRVVSAERALSPGTGRRARHRSKKTRERIRFAVQQWIDAASPSNFLALNPEAQQKAIETKGESLARA